MLNSVCPWPTRGVKKVKWLFQHLSVCNLFCCRLYRYTCLLQTNILESDHKRKKWSFFLGKTISLICLWYLYDIVETIFVFIWLYLFHLRCSWTKPNRSICRRWVFVFNKYLFLSHFEENCMVFFKGGRSIKTKKKGFYWFSGHFFICINVMQHHVKTALQQKLLFN